MTTSGGGGFCDCGDSEAWKKGPYCQKHTPTAQSRDSEEVSHRLTRMHTHAHTHARVSCCTLCPHQDPEAQLPADLVSRAYSIFAIILKYAVDMLTWEQADKLPAGLEPPYEQTHTVGSTAVGVIIFIRTLFCVQGQRRHVLLHVVQ